MSNLEALKERLKHKPEVRPNEGVRVLLAPLSSEDPLVLYKPDEPADKVLEISAGLSSDYTIKKGDNVIISN